MSYASKNFSSRSIIEINLINALDDDDGDGDDDILNSHNFLSHDRYKNRYHFRELDVLVKSFWNVIYHLNWVRFASRNLNCLCSLTLLLIKLIAKIKAMNVTHFLTLQLLLQETIFTTCIIYHVIAQKKKYIFVQKNAIFQ